MPTPTTPLTTLPNPWTGRWPSVRFHFSEGYASKKTQDAVGNRLEAASDMALPGLRRLVTRSKLFASTGLIQININLCVPYRDLKPRRYTAKIDRTVPCLAIDLSVDHKVVRTTSTSELAADIRFTAISVLDDYLRRKKRPNRAIQRALQRTTPPRRSAFPGFLTGPKDKETAARETEFQITVPLASSPPSRTERAQLDKLDLALDAQLGQLSVSEFTRETAASPHAPAAADFFIVTHAPAAVLPAIRRILDKHGIARRATIIRRIAYSDSPGARVPRN